MKRLELVTRDEVLGCLKRVVDPELGINIVDLGLIYDIKFQNTNDKLKIELVMTLTTPGCPLAGVFGQMVKKELDGLGGIEASEDVKIEFVFDPPWTAEMMSEEAKAQLGFG